MKFSSSVTCQTNDYYSLTYKLLHVYYVNRISEEDYIRFIKEETYNVVKLQEELDIDVLVHGEPEVRRDDICYYW